MVFGVDNSSSSRIIFSCKERDQFRMLMKVLVRQRRKFVLTSGKQGQRFSGVYIIHRR